LENLKEENYLEDRGLDARIILKLTLMKYSEKVWTGNITVCRPMF
jgi:hypothetical protein